MVDIQKFADDASAMMNAESELFRQLVDLADKQSAQINRLSVSVVALLGLAVSKNLATEDELVKLVEHAEAALRGKEPATPEQEPQRRWH